VTPRTNRTVPNLDLGGDEEGAETPGAFNYNPPDPYATNNPPLLMMDNMADTIAEHPLRDTDCQTYSRVSEIYCTMTRQ
jgi:hypothetical protein